LAGSLLVNQMGGNGYKVTSHKSALNWLQQWVNGCYIPLFLAVELEY